MRSPKVQLGQSSYSMLEVSGQREIIQTSNCVLLLLFFLMILVHISTPNSIKRKAKLMNIEKMKAKTKKM